MIKYLTIIFGFILFGCVDQSNIKTENYFFDRDEIFNNTKQRNANIQYKSNDTKRAIVVRIYWEENQGTEYSEYGKITKIEVLENNKKYDKCINYDLSHIEDFDLESAVLISPKLGYYVFGIAWGAGEMRAHPTFLKIK